MKYKDSVDKLIQSFDSTRSEETRHHNSPSMCDVIATQYMRRIREGQKKAARKNAGLVFEG